LPTVAFDSKRFRRGRLEREISSSNPTQGVTRYIGFNSPLGAGVWFKDEEEFENDLVEEFRKLADDFVFELDRPFLCSTDLKRILGLQKAIPFADKLLQAVQHHVKQVFISFVVLPPQKHPTVGVGGYKSTTVQVATTKFLEDLGPMFSYITAYAFLGKPVGVPDWNMRIDAFKSKSTEAWNELTSRITPSVYYRGDECDPYICLADIIVFLTDAKLYSKKLHLNPSNVEAAWDGYGFKVKTRFLDENMLSKIRWYSDDTVDYSRYVAKPVLYLMIDELENIGPTPTDEGLDSEEIGVEHLPVATPPVPAEPKSQKFRDVIQKSPIYSSAVKYANNRKGCLKVFERSQDIAYVSDKDILVYVGPRSKNSAMTFKDAYDVEVMSGKELRKLSSKL